MVAEGHVEDSDLLEQHLAIGSCRLAAFATYHLGLGNPLGLLFLLSLRRRLANSSAIISIST